MATAREEKRTAKASTSVTVESSNGTKAVAVKKTATIKEKEKRVFSLAGQKHEPPNERDALRVFYETLREQIPSSEMAELWLMEHGLLSAEDAQKAYEKKQQGRPKVATLLGKVKPELHGGEVVEVQETKIKEVFKARRKLDSNSESDDDFIASKKSKGKPESQEESGDGKKMVVASKKLEVKLESQKDIDDGKGRAIVSKKLKINLESHGDADGKGRVKPTVVSVAKGCKPETASEGKRKLDNSESDDDFIVNRKPKVKRTA